MIGLTALAAAHALSLNCVVESARKLVVDGETITTPLINIQPEVTQWTFALSLRDTGDRIDVSLNWPGDPLTLGKVVGAIPVGQHDYAFTSLHGGPCLFTQTACITMFTLSEQADGSADILVQPAAIMGAGEWSRPFQVFMKGRCTPSGGAQ